jgi:hypothetical protein
MRPFTYAPLDPARHEICVISLHRGQGDDPIECTLRHVSLDEIPVYGALSYAWGDTENPARILLNGQDVELTANLAAALLHLRAAGTREMILWTDVMNRANRTTIRCILLACFVGAGQFYLGMYKVRSRDQGLALSTRCYMHLSRSIPKQMLQELEV